MNKKVLIVFTSICFVIGSCYTITYFEAFKKDDRIVFENLILKEREVSIEALDLEDAATIIAELSNVSKDSANENMKLYIESLLGNDKNLKLEYYKAKYDFGFEDIENVDGEMVSLVIVSNSKGKKKIEDAFFVNTKVHSKDYQLLWNQGSTSLDINKDKTVVRIAGAGYLEIKSKKSIQKVYYSNTLYPIYEFNI